MRKFIAYFSYIDGIELSPEIAAKCSHMGDCEQDVIEAMQLPEVQQELNRINPDQLRKELKEYGAWDEEQRADHHENLIRILWLAACSITESEEYRDYIDENY